MSPSPAGYVFPILSLGLSFEQNLGRVAKWSWALAPGSQILRKGHPNVRDIGYEREKENRQIPKDLWPHQPEARKQAVEEGVL